VSTNEDRRSILPAFEDEYGDQEVNETEIIEQDLANVPFDDAAPTVQTSFSMVIGDAANSESRSVRGTNLVCAKYAFTESGCARDDCPYSHKDSGISSYERERTLNLLYGYTKNGKVRLDAKKCFAWGVNLKKISETLLHHNLGFVEYYFDENIKTLLAEKGRLNISRIYIHYDERFDVHDGHSFQYITSKMPHVVGGGKLKGILEAAMERGACILQPEGKSWDVCPIETLTRGLTNSNAASREDVDSEAEADDQIACDHCGEIGHARSSCLSLDQSETKAPKQEPKFTILLGSSLEGVSSFNEKVSICLANSFKIKGCKNDECTYRHVPNGHEPSESERASALRQIYKWTVPCKLDLETCSLWGVDINQLHENVKLVSLPMCASCGEKGHSAHVCPTRFRLKDGDGRMATKVADEAAATSAAAEEAAAVPAARGSGGGADGRADSTHPRIPSRRAPGVQDAHPDIACFNCGAVGHYAQDCAQDFYGCDICQQTNHFSNKCPSKASASPSSKNGAGNIGFQSKTSVTKQEPKFTRTISLSSSSERAPSNYKTERAPSINKKVSTRLSTKNDDEKSEASIIKNEPELTFSIDLSSDGVRPPGDYDFKKKYKAERVSKEPVISFSLGSMSNKAASLRQEPKISFSLDEQPHEKTFLGNRKLGGDREAVSLSVGSELPSRRAAKSKGKAPITFAQTTKLDSSLPSSSKPASPTKSNTKSTGPSFTKNESMAAALNQVASRGGMNAQRRRAANLLRSDNASFPERSESFIFGSSIKESADSSVYFNATTVGRNVSTTQSMKSKAGLPGPKTVASRPNDQKKSVPKSSGSSIDSRGELVKRSLVVAAETSKSAKIKDSNTVASVKPVVPEEPIAEPRKRPRTPELD